MSSIKINLLNIGKINYEMYREAVGGVTWNGDKMKEFEEMPDNIQKAWFKAGIGIITSFTAQTKYLQNEYFCKHVYGVPHI